MLGLLPAAVVAKDSPASRLRSIPFCFTENKGQLAQPGSEHVFYTARQGGLSLCLTEKGLSYTLYRACDSLTMACDRVDMTLEHAHISEKNIVAEDQLAFERSYYLPGCPAGISKVHSYARLRIKEVYPGIDWILYSEAGGRFKYDFEVHPGADPNDIRLLFACQGHISSDGHSLGISTASGSLHDGALQCFQSAKTISSHYNIEQLSCADSLNRYRVTIGLDKYNRQQALTIDPAVTWATNLDGAGIVRDVDYDAQGNVYLLGLESPITNMPILNTGSGYHQALPASNDIVIYKFDLNGALIWCTNFGGSDDEAPNILAVSPTGTLYVTGRTASSDLPVMNSGGFYQGTLNASGPNQTDAFILKFDAGCNLLWSTYIGATAAVEDFTSACFDLSGNIVLAGIVSSQQMPLANGGGYFDNTYNGGYDGYIARFSPSDALLHGTFLGTPGSDFSSHGCLRIISDKQGNIWMCGNVDTQGMPYVSNGGYFSNVLTGGSDAVFGKFDPAFNLVWLTNFGGSSYDGCSDLTIDRCGNVWVSGFTLSADLPVVNGGGYMHTIAPGDSLEGFIVKLNSACQLTWATYLGGNKADWFNAIVTDGMNVWTLGFSNSTNLPAVPMGGGLNQSSNGGGEDAMIYCFNQSTALVYASYFGNAAAEELQAAALDSVHNRLYFVGQMPTYHAPPFYMKTQATPGSYQSTGNDDGFVVQLSVNKAAMPFSYVVHDTTLCTNEPLLLQSGLAPPGTYLWSSGATTNSLSVNNSGTYWVNDVNNCQLYTDTFHVVLNPVPVLTVPGDATIEEGSSLQVHASSSVGAQYAWSPTGSLSCGNCLDPVATPAQSTSYCLMATTGPGCGDTACFHITVIKKPCPALADNPLPEAFTPNGDGTNDVYAVNGWGFCLREFNFKIFDRWGEKLFETSDPHINWDGRYMNKDVETGVYVYQLTALTRDDEKLSRKGTITLNR